MYYWILAEKPGKGGKAPKPVVRGESTSRAKAWEAVEAAAAAHVNGEITETAAPNGEQNGRNVRRVYASSGSSAQLIGNVIPVS